MEDDLATTTPTINNTELPTTPMVNNDKKKSSKGLKIVTVIACIIAVCGIGFGVFEVIQSAQKDSQISDLKTQINNTATTIDAIENKSVNIDQTAGTLVETATDEEKTIAWPADTERLEGEPETLVNKIVLPKITIASEAAKSLNNKIVDKYSKYLEDKQTFSKGPSSITTNYDSVVSLSYY